MFRFWSKLAAVSRTKTFAPKIWNKIPVDIRNVNNLSDFTLKIKSWIPGACPYNLWRPYICQVGYIN